MLLESRYNQIVDAIRRHSFNREHFERMAVCLTNDSGLSVRPVTGGSDAGFDGAISQPNCEPGPLVVTTQQDVIGNLTRSLTRVIKERPKAARTTALVTSRRLSELKQNNLRERARSLGFILTDIFEEAAVCEYLYRHSDWSRSLLQVTGDLSALSVYPASRRFLHDIQVLHRSEELEWLKSLKGDALLSGPPGSGKTSLLRCLALEGFGLFATTSDAARIIVAIREIAPRFVFVDDIEGSASLCAELVRARSELYAEFCVVATTWGGNLQLMQTLGLVEGEVLVLEQLSLEQMVDVVHATGLTGPDVLVDDVVKQAEGLPGLAVSLAVACLRGSVRDVLTGAAIAREFYSALERLFGEYEQAALMLAGLSVGGGKGMRLSPVSELTGISQTEMHKLLRSLLRELAASGFILPLRNDLWTVRPHRLRSVLIRDMLLSPPSLDIEPLLSSVPSRATAIREVIGAVAVGAQADRLREWVESVPDSRVLAEYAWLGSSESGWVLEKYPDRVTEFAGATLHFVPDAAIPALLSLAAGDDRPTNAYPEHPLRLLQEWANPVPEQGVTPLKRKHTLIEQSKEWLGRVPEGTDTAFNAFATALSTEFRGGRLSPGDGRRLVITWGIYSSEQIGKICEYWRELVPFLRSLDHPNWVPLVDALHSIACPQQVNGDTQAAKAASRELAENMVRDISAMAANNPGILSRLSTLSERAELDVDVQVDQEFETLFGDGRHGKEWREEEKRIEKEVERLASVWLERGPSWAMARMKSLLVSNESAGKAADRTPGLCGRLAESTTEPTAWLRSAVEADLPSRCVSPFLVRVVEREGAIPDSVVEELCMRQSLQPAMAYLLLTGRLAAGREFERVLDFLPNYTSLVDLHAVRGEISEDVLGILLDSPSSAIRQAAAIGSWKDDERGFSHEALREKWEEAILNCQADDYWLGEILESEPELAFRWLKRNQNRKGSSRLLRGDFVSSIAARLTQRQRIQLLKALKPSWGSAYICALVGDSTEVYSALLNLEHLGRHRLDPFVRRPDETWTAFVEIAVSFGLSTSDIAQAALGGLRCESGPVSQMWLALASEFQAFANHQRVEVRNVTQQCLQWLQSQIDCAIQAERHESVYGLDVD